jgi:hypothetical protein
LVSLSSFHGLGPICTGFSLCSHLEKKEGGKMERDKLKKREKMGRQQIRVVA